MCKVYKLSTYSLWRENFVSTTVGDALYELQRFLIDTNKLDK